MNAPGAPTRPAGHPVLRADLRARLRSSIGAALVTGWALVIVAVAVAVVLHHTGTDDPLRSTAVDRATVGRSLGQWWVISCTLGMAVLGPAASVGAFAGAREARTWATWEVSLLRPRHLVGGNLAGSAAVLALAALAACPVGALAWRLGGAPAPMLAVGLAGAWCTGVVAAAIGLAASAFARRVSTAAAVSALVVVGLLAGTSLAHSMGHDRGGSGSPDAVMLANPVVAVADAAASTGGPPAAAASGDATDAPLDHARSVVHTTTGRAGPAEPWVTAGAGAVLVTLVAWVVATAGVRRRR